MTHDRLQESTIKPILDQFKKGALLNEEGYLYSDPAASDQGLALIRSSLKELDTLGPHSRDALIPLLDDSSAAIRARTAAALIRIVPDRALAVLHEIRDRSMSDSRMIAARLLILYEEGQLDY